MRGLYMLLLMPLDPRAFHVAFSRDLVSPSFRDETLVDYLDAVKLVDVQHPSQHANSIAAALRCQLKDPDQCDDGLGHPTSSVLRCGSIREVQRVSLVQRRRLAKRRLSLAYTTSGILHHA
eukprot:scaffold3951_cov258-Pinguiococcus_pyrenoidosus.AAC.3